MSPCQGGLQGVRPSIMKNNQTPYIPYDKNLVNKARANRKNPTPAEKKMWYEVLRNREFEDLKFTRQKPLDRYIVDFYCAELKLAVEIDGDSHAEQEAVDRLRTEKLGHYGITVIRYTNSEVLHQLHGVYTDLSAKVKLLREKKYLDKTGSELPIIPLDSEKTPSSAIAEVPLDRGIKYNGFFRPVEVEPQQEKRTCGFRRLKRK